MKKRTRKRKAKPPTELEKRLVCALFPYALGLLPRRKRPM